MKIRPVILCGGAGTRLWPKGSKHQAKQFIDFGGWTLINKTFERIKNNIYDYPIISTNAKYIKEVKKALKKSKIKKFKIVLELKLCFDYSTGVILSISSVSICCSENCWGNCY